MLPSLGSEWRHWLFLSILVISLAPGLLKADDWPQFRGPEGRGVAVSNRVLPGELGPTQNVIWRTELPPGHSSPVVVGDQIGRAHV